MEEDIKQEIALFTKDQDAPRFVEALRVASQRKKHKLTEYIRAAEPTETDKCARCRNCNNLFDPTQLMRCFCDAHDTICQGCLKIAPKHKEPDLKIIQNTPTCDLKSLEDKKPELQKQEGDEGEKQLKQSTSETCEQCK